jgi:hypothetical protein
MLPPQGQELLHGYMQLMWAKEYTRPSSWKESSTMLLFENKDTPSPQSYNSAGA